MASISDICIQEIYDYFKLKGNVVQNREIVHYFKSYLTDPYSKDDARAKFKKFVNILAHSKTENGEKFLILRSKYHNSLDIQPKSPQFDPINMVGIPISPVPCYHDITPPIRHPPPYRPPPPAVLSQTQSLSSKSLNSIKSLDCCTPQAPPRRRSISQKFEDDKKIEERNDELQISVKERTQKFNRMASVEDELSPSPRKSTEKKIENKGVDDDDGASVTSLEPKKCVEWYVTASKGDLQALVKLAKDEPRLVNKKDPFTVRWVVKTVLHWGAKHGDAEIIKVFAGRYKVNVNSRTNGGYTPLHIAAQFDRKDIFKLLIEVYKADSKILDYSGRLPEYYFISKENKENEDIVHKIKTRKKQTDKDLGFLRIGSLNVRVKKTTEAFSHFLGVGGSSGSIGPLDSMAARLHKGWGSADNVNQNSRTKNNGPKKKSKRPADSIGLSSVPGTPQQSTRNIHLKNFCHDSDSDSAAGFDSQWKIVK